MMTESDGEAVRKHKKPEPKQNNPDVAVAEFNRKWKEEWRKTLQPTPWAIRLD